MRFKKLIVALLLAAASFGAMAQQGAIILPGGASCGWVVDQLSRKNEPQGVANMSMVTGWIWGYMSRHNLDHAHNPISIPRQAVTLDLYIEKYCRENPLKLLNDATDQLIIDLGGIAKPKK